jgi:hypothetical protein
MSTGRAIVAAAAAAAVARGVRRLPDPPIAGWQRTNYRGREVSLSGGLATAIGAIAGGLLAGPRRTATVLAGSAALIAGAYDDVFAPRAESSADKGLAGHVRALRSGRVSGGVVKVVVIGTGSWLAAGQLTDRLGIRLSGAALIAGSANLVNLFDLRPGRAAKVTLAVSAGSAFSGELAAVTGATIAGWPDDLGERTMLGDLGANTVGALIGLRLAAAPAAVRIGALAVVGALTLASERVSFSRVIADVPALNWLDQLGRRPADDEADAMTGVDA